MPRPGPVRVCVRPLLLAGLDGSASRARFGAPHFSFGRFVLLPCSAPYGLGLPLLCFSFVLRSCLVFFFFSLLVACAPAVSGFLRSPSRGALGFGALVFFCPPPRPRPAYFVFFFLSLLQRSFLFPVFFFLFLSLSLSPGPPPTPFLCCVFLFLFFSGFFWGGGWGGFPCSFVPPWGFGPRLLCVHWCCCCAVRVLLARWGGSPSCRLLPCCWAVPAICLVCWLCVVASLGAFFACAPPPAPPRRCSWCCVVAFVLSCCCAVSVHPLAFVLLGSAPCCSASVLGCACWPWTVVSCGALTWCAAWCAPPLPPLGHHVWCFVLCCAVLPVSWCARCCVVWCLCHVVLLRPLVLLLLCGVLCFVPWCLRLVWAVSCGPRRFSVLRCAVLVLWCRAARCAALLGCCASHRFCWCPARPCCAVLFCVVLRCVWCNRVLLRSVVCSFGLCGVVVRCVVWCAAVRRCAVLVLLCCSALRPPPSPPAAAFVGCLCSASCRVSPYPAACVVLCCAAPVPSLLAVRFALCRCLCLVLWCVVVCFAVSFGVPWCCCPAVWCGASWCSGVVRGVAPSCVVARCGTFFVAVCCPGALCRLVCRCTMLPCAGFAFLSHPPPPAPTCCCPRCLAVPCVLSCFAVSCCACGALLRCAAALVLAVLFGLCCCRCLVLWCVVVRCAVGLGVLWCGGVALLCGVACFRALVPGAVPCGAVLLCAAVLPGSAVLFLFCLWFSSFFFL